MRDKEEEIGLTQQDEQADLDLEIANSSPRAPQKVEGISTGPRQVLSKTETRARRTSLARMIACGKPDDFIFDEMEKLYGMDEEAVKRLMNKIFATWKTEDDARSPYFKAAARRRMYEEIEKAGQSDQWNAVASLEKTLSSVEGTIEEEKTSTPAEIRQINALVFVLGEITPEKLNEIVGDEARRFGPTPIFKNDLLKNDLSINLPVSTHKS